ncbi:hypothetical protein AKJ09_08104 [Labilithrix luteola]|uniref:Uncharacterized protein n=1 Tax=Labilithrix luteola TaxID=1391654 RepID=A0A0K1Q6H6_9BACT|nr:hypothetical protein AKJ09_08104 [Labilithrix luteola]
MGPGIARGAPGRDARASSGEQTPLGTLPPGHHGARRRRSEGPVTTIVAR